jgi:hypothetical protein
MRSPCCLWVCVSVYPPYQLLNAWTNLYETWYVYYGIWAQSSKISASPCQHSRSWFRAPLEPMTIFLFFPDFYIFWNGASSSTRRGVKLIPVTSALMRSNSDDSRPQSICLSFLSLLGNGSVNTFARQRIYKTMEELLEASFSMRSSAYRRRVCGSFCVSPFRWQVTTR